jgi:aspartyl-tRNA(Asn)/glutamyl-tRNA(Gln) amidotransferase subunit A
MQDAFTTLADATSALRSGAISSESLTRGLLDRIGRFDPQVHAFVTVTADAALGQARQADLERARGQVRGPLHGVPVAVKDNVDVAGVRTSCHSDVTEGHVASRDATVVARLREAGAVIVGKTGLWEYAYGVPGPADRIPPPRNPWSLGHSPGGSSSGSGAAVAAGLAFGAIGTDTGGSIRHPSSVCGLVGLKPTYGLVSQDGVVPVSLSLDHVGPMTRTVRDNALMLEAIAGFDPRDPNSRRAPDGIDFAARIGRPLAGLRAGVPSNLIERGGNEPEVLRAFAAALERLRTLGLQVVEFDMRCADDVHADSTVILEYEAWREHRSRLADPRLAGLYGPGLRKRLEGGAARTDEAYAQARRKAVQTTREVDALMVDERFDVLLMPGREAPAMTMSELMAASPSARGRMTRLGNLTGMPALVLPMGFTAGTPGLPLALQVMSRHFCEPVVYQVAAAYEASEPWSSRHPDWLR